MQWVEAVIVFLVPLQPAVKGTKCVQKKRNRGSIVIICLCNNKGITFNYPVNTTLRVTNTGNHKEDYCQDFQSKLMIPLNATCSIGCALYHRVRSFQLHSLGTRYLLGMEDEISIHYRIMPREYVHNH